MAVTTISEKLKEAAQIKRQIRDAASEKDVEFPEDTPFAEYPGIISQIPGHLQTKTITPTAEGGTIAPDSGYDGFSSITLPEEPDLVPKSIITGRTIFGIAGTAEAPTFDVGELFGRTLTEIVSGVAKIASYAFYKFTSLQKVEFQNLTEMGDYAFQGCTGLKSFLASKLENIPTYGLQECTALATMDFSNIKSIGDYGLQNCKNIAGIEELKASQINQYGAYYLGSNVSQGFVYNPSEQATIGDDGLRYAKITDIKGEIKKVGSYGIADLGSQFTKFSGKFVGEIGSYGFANNKYLKEVDFSQSTITSIGTYAFYYLGWSRSGYNTDPYMELDFRNCKFKTVDQYAMGYIRYANIHLPDTVKTINAYAFRYDTYINVYMAASAPPTMAANNCFNNASNYKVFVAYHYLHAYSIATNWSSLTSYMIGYAPSGKWTDGETLPEVNGEGYALTWYSDTGKTTEVSEVPEGSPELYCTIGDKIKSIIAIKLTGDIVLTFTDADGKEYAIEDGYVIADTGTVMTVNATIPEGYVGYINLGSGKITEFPYTFTLEDDVTLKGSGYDPNATNPDFASATWQEIKTAVSGGVSTAMYADQVGTIKEIELKDGNTMQIRLTNATDDMYEYADGSGTTGLVMEFVDLWPKTYYMNSSNTNAGGWDASYMRNTVMPLILQQLPDDLTDVIATVKVKACKSGNDGTIVESADKLFLPAERELFGSRSYSRKEEWNALSQFQYYKNNNTNAARVKKRGGSTAFWWERSPNNGNSSNFCNVNSDGSANNNNASNGYGVGPCFCI